MKNKQNYVAGPQDFGQKALMFLFVAMTSWTEVGRTTWVLILPGKATINKMRHVVKLFLNLFFI